MTTTAAVVRPRSMARIGLTRFMLQDRSHLASTKSNAVTADELNLKSNRVRRSISTTGDPDALRHLSSPPRPRPAAPERGCLRAVETILRLTLAEPSSIVSPFSANDLLVVKAPRDAGCLDEGPVETAAPGVSGP